MVLYKILKNMKLKNLLFTVVIAGTTLGYMSCKKTNDTATDNTTETKQAAADQSTTDNLMDDANNAFDESCPGDIMGNIVKGSDHITNQVNGCAVVTVTGNFPNKTITIDFGSGCMGTNGNIRKGIITVVVSDSLQHLNATAVMNFTNFYVNDHHIEGTVTWKNTGGVFGVNRSWDRTVVNGKITAPDGRYWLHSGFRHVVQDFHGTPDPRDDRFTIFPGNHQITNAMGRTHNDTIINPLVRFADCHWTQEGSVKVTGPMHTCVLDFSYNPSGTHCDNWATRSVDGGTPVAFQLP
jgi:hypothetical protein